MLIPTSVSPKANLKRRTSNVKAKANADVDANANANTNAIDAISVNGFQALRIWLRRPSLLVTTHEPAAAAAAAAVIFRVNWHDPAPTFQHHELANLAPRLQRHLSRGRSPFGRPQFPTAQPIRHEQRLL